MKTCKAHTLERLWPAALLSAASGCRVRASFNPSAAESSELLTNPALQIKKEKSRRAGEFRLLDFSLTFSCVCHLRPVGALTRCVGSLFLSCENHLTPPAAAAAPTTTTTTSV